MIKGKKSPEMRCTHEHACCRYFHKLVPHPAPSFSSSSRRPLDGSHSPSSLLSTRPSLTSPKTTLARWICGWRSSLEGYRRIWLLSSRPGAGLSRRKWLRAWPVCLSGRKTPCRRTSRLRVKRCAQRGVCAGRGVITHQLCHPFSCLVYLEPESYFLPVLRKAFKVLRQNGTNFLRLLCCFYCFSTGTLALIKRLASPSSSSRRGCFILASWVSAGSLLLFMTGSIKDHGFHYNLISLPHPSQPWTKLLTSALRSFLTASETGWYNGESPEPASVLWKITKLRLHLDSYPWHGIKIYCLMMVNVFEHNLQTHRRELFSFHQAPQ